MRIGDSITTPKDPIADWATSVRRTISNTEKSHPKWAKRGGPVNIVAHAGPVLRAMRHRSADNPVKSREIETALGAGGPTVRVIISHLRRQGYPIVSNGKGYHYDETWEGILDTIRRLEQRRNANNTVIKELQAGYDKAHNTPESAKDWTHKLLDHCSENGSR